MWTAEQEARLNYLDSVLGGQASASPPDSGIGPRIGQQAANFLPNVAEGLANSAVGFTNLFEPSYDQIPRAAIPKPYDIAPPQTTGQRLVDTGAGLGSAVAQALIPGGIATRLAGAAGASASLAPIIGDIAAGGFMGLGQSPQEGAAQATEFGAIGAANRFIPSIPGRILANAAIPVTGQLLRGQNPLDQQSLINTGANIAVPAILGQYGRRLGERPAPQVEPTNTVTPDGQIVPYVPPQRGFTMPGYERPGMVDPASEPPQWINPQPMAPREPVALLPYEADTTTEFQGRLARRLRPPEAVIPGEPPPVQSIPQGLFDSPTGPLPEPRGLLRRSDEAGALNPSNPAFQYLVGASGGALAGPLVDQDPDKPIWEKMLEGAAVGAGGVAAGRRLLRPQPTSGMRMNSEQGSVGLGGKPGDYDALAKQRWNETEKTQAIKPADAERTAIRKAYDAEVEEKGFPSVSIASVLERAGFTPAEMDHARGLIQHMGQTGEIVSLNPGDWSLSSQRDRAWAVNAQKRSSMMDAPSLMMRMGEPPAGMKGGGGETGSLNLSSPATQYALGAGVGAVAGPVVDDDKSKPLLQRMAEGAIVGAGAVAAVHGGRRLLQSGTPIAQAAAPPVAPAAAKPGILQLLSRLAADQEIGKKTTGGGLIRTAERELGLGKSEAQSLAEERGKGAANDLRLQAKPLLRTIYSATDPEVSAMKAYDVSDRSAGAQSLFRSAVRPEISTAYEKAETLLAKGQDILADADPTKRPLIDATKGDWRTRKYSAFADGAEWELQKSANPNLRGDYVDQLVSDNVLPGFTRREVEQAVGEYEAEIQRGSTFGEGGNGSHISQRLWQHRKDLSPEHRAFLGEYTDPRQRIAFSLSKISNSAAQAKTISELVDAGKRGELDVMTREERRVAMQAAQAKGDTARVEQLASLLELDPNAKGFGKMAGMMVPRAVVDSLNAHGQLWDKPGGWMSKLTQIMKTSMTTLNPGTHARNMIQLPLMGAFARVHPGDMWAAGKEIRAKGPIWEEAVRNNIVGANFSAVELEKGAKALDSLLNPTALQKGRQILGKGMDAVKHAYGLPDDLVRMAAYMRQRARFFAEGNAQGLKGDALSRFAQDKATTFVNRYTQNYSAVPNAIGVARQTPFVTPFLSYQYTMGRILKNLAEDVVKGSPSDRAWAVANLGAAIAMPLGIAAFAKASLSDKDAADWEKVQKLGKYSAGQIQVPLGRKRDGSFNYVNLGNLVPAGDAAAFVRNLASGDLDKVWSANPIFGQDKSPVLNALSEIQSGRDSTTDKPIEGGLPGALAHQIPRLLPPLVPPNYEGQRLLRSFQTNDQGGFGVENSRTGKTDTPGTFLLRNVAGVAVSQVQPKTLIRRAQADQQEKEGQIKSELRQILQTNASGETKQAAKQQALLRLRAVKEETRRLLR